MRIHEPSQTPGRVAGLVGTVVVHAGAVLFLVAAVKPTRASPPSYAVELVAAPAPTTKRLAREALPTPPPEEKPAPTPPKPAPPQKDKPAPVTPKPPKPVKTTPTPAPKPPPTETEREPAPRTAAAVAPVPGETPSTGTDVATIKTPGLAFPYPEYLRNIVTQVYQRWDRASAKQNSFAEISFLILRDGSVRDIRFVTRSGSFAFDLDAQGAIEAAGNTQAFGQLPDGWEADVLPVSFYFQPTR
ncbi:MAG TPA: TonB C-terminal domain-containing protein [Gemmatimonadales bacterium]|nr:TonB C-terminal domain-containing protein [Gemmatimonadales bacterium]